MSHPSPVPSPVDPGAHSDHPSVDDHDAVHDVVIVGGGLAGLSLARHLLLHTSKRVTLLEKRKCLPPNRQKVGESSVQVAGYYFSKVLDMEAYLFHQHFMKYNLRFYFKTEGRDNAGLEDYSQTYIRPFSNIASYQIDRNVFEAELLRRNRADGRFADRLGVTDLDITFADDGLGADSAEVAARAGDEPHVVRFRQNGETHEIKARWVIDTSGRGKHVARRMDLKKENNIDHGAFFWWVDGLVDIEKLTGLSPDDVRKAPSRRHVGHLPLWMATNHFMDEGLWFWVIPLQGKTSLGLVFDKAVVNHRDVFTVEKATNWVCERFPLFARDLPQREVIDFGGYQSFSYDCQQTISPARWALAGEAGRFSDPLYSPGSDLISFYNTFIVDAIETDDADALRTKCGLYEQLMRSVYAAYEPTYERSYDALGDAEAFTLKYTWELTIYFAFYVFPFINDLMTDRRFTMAFLRTFARLGPMNKQIQALLSDYYQWKKVHARPDADPVYMDFTDIKPLWNAAQTFYEVGVAVDEAKRILNAQYNNVEELARFVYAHVASAVVDDPRARSHRAFVESLDVRAIEFDPEAMRQQWERCRDMSDEAYPWSFDASVTDVFHSGLKTADEIVGAGDVDLASMATAAGPIPNLADAAASPAPAAPAEEDA